MATKSSASSAVWDSRIDPEAPSGDVLAPLARLLLALARTKLERREPAAVGEALARMREGAKRD